MFEGQNVSDNDMLLASLQHTVKPHDALEWLLKIEEAKKELSCPVELLTGIFPLIDLLFKQKMDFLFCVSEVGRKRRPLDLQCS